MLEYNKRAKLLGMNADALKLELNLGSDNRTVVDFGGPVAPLPDSAAAPTTPTPTTPTPTTGPAPLTVFTGGAP